MLHEYENTARKALSELLEVAKLTQGDIIVVGCSTSEIAGHRIGTSPGPEIAQALLAGFIPIIKENGLFLAAQCCEHLERALVVEADAMRLYGLERVNAIPMRKAGGSFATAAYATFENPVLIRGLKAAAGLDIGGTMIGMHLRAVAVPLRLDTKKIGEAPLSAARTRLPFVGGERAVYDTQLL